jgi:outer membrane murein-binding lipoprotein Lpp
MKQLKTHVFIAVVLSALAWAGCSMTSSQPDQAKSGTPVAAPGAQARTTTSPAGNPDYLSQLAVKSEGPDGKSASAVESAIAWSEKYSKVAEDLVKIQQEKHDLEDKNQKLVAQVTKLQNDQDAAQKELTEANQLLLEMRKDLEKWKTDVIGFRDEMRSANKAQLEATKKVIVLLGGEVPASAAATTQPAGPAGPAATKARKGDSVEAGE